MSRPGIPDTDVISSSESGLTEVVLCSVVLWGTLGPPLPGGVSGLGPAWMDRGCDQGAAGQLKPVKK